ncbi:MAG: transglycosylase domain-containing protein [Patescibacteria group bacterium]
MSSDKRRRLLRHSSTGDKHYVTKKGNKIKLHKSLSSKILAKKDERSRRRAAYLATLPDGRLQRILYRLHPKRVYKYWASPEGRVMALKLFGIGTLVVFLLIVGVFAYFRKDLPNLRDISGNKIGGSIRYYDKTGTKMLWEDYDAVKRTPVKDEEIPPFIEDATVAIEDKDFYKHGGFDAKGITRAGINNITGSSGGTQGGSTITQQLVKLTQNWSKERTYTRKVKELILAVELERTYSKKEILTGYLNTAPYGDITYGVESSMQDYFNKPAKDMTLDEAAFLAAIPKSPTYYSPYGSRFNREALEGRQDYILDQMVQQGKISQDKAKEAKDTDTLAKLKPRKPKYDGITAPWFVLAAKEQLQAKFGAETVLLGGWKVTTTLDLDKQKIAEEEVAKGMRQVRAQGGDTAAFVAENVKTGQVDALVGGTDFFDEDHGQNNYARLKLPPGSSFKPYDYLSVIENTQDFGAGSVLYDSQEFIDGYPCTNKASAKQGGNCLHNYDLKYTGPITLRYALGGSRNVPAVKAMLIAGVDKTIETADKLGLKDLGDEREGMGYKCYKDEQQTKETPCYSSAGIGDGAYLKLDEHVHAFSTISRNGNLVPQTYIMKIEDASNKNLYEWKQSAGKQVVRDESAYIVADMMSDANASYFSRKPQRYLGHKFALKTGTTNDRKDGWMMGFSTQYSAGVWVGYHNRQKEMSGAMEVMTEPIWSGYMKRIHKDLKAEERPKPKGLQTLPAFVIRNHVGFGSIEPSPANDLFPSWYKKKTKSNSNEVIDIVSNKIATDCTPARAKKPASNANANLFSSDKFHGGGTSGTTEKDDIHKCEDAKPAISVSVDPVPCITTCRITATATSGTHPISSAKFAGTINIKVGSQVVHTAQIGDSPSTISFNYAVTTPGEQSVTAEVIDSVLYDATDSRTVTMQTASAFSLTAKIAGPKTKFSWSGGSGTVTIYNSANTPLCDSGPSSGCEVNVALAPNSSSVYARDSSSATTTATVGP